MKLSSLFIIVFFTSSVVSGQGKESFVVRYDTTGKEKYGYVFTDHKGDTIARLDTARYYLCFSDTVKHFAIVGIRGKKGWWAINRNEKLLFQVFNASIGEPSPDQIRERFIRIVDAHGRIGFANDEGKVVIQPKFEMVSSFYNGKAIIGRGCKEVLWCCEGENADKHYTIECKETGYINQKGQIRKIGRYSFVEIQKTIGWKGEYDE